MTSGTPAAVLRARLQRDRCLKLSEQLETELLEGVGEKAKDRRTAARVDAPPKTLGRRAR